MTTMRSPPIDRFSSAGEPSAITRPLCITAMRPARRSASSRKCVVSSTAVRARRPPARPATLRRIRGVQGRGRLVQEQHCPVSGRVGQAAGEDYGLGDAERSYRFGRDALIRGIEQLRDAP
ncbi:hypothetical protein [Microbacterium sp. Bi121]|uniref:hypothetical protein n=1 Tax=Microbacterium sp. Bi121 TaxID=2822348 RepID=UPI001E607510|nr:hypothetical protein [Microbacterium sp. Bi121]